MGALVFLSGPAAGLRYEITGQLTIGRSRACEIALEDDKVSRQHARIELEHGEPTIRDLGSRNGTRVNGQRISSEVALLDGDRIQLGDSTAKLDAEEKLGMISRWYRDTFGGWTFNADKRRQVFGDCLKPRGYELR